MLVSTAVPEWGRTKMSLPPQFWPVRLWRVPPSSPLAMSALGCRAFDEDPSEFLCHFQAQEPTGVWRKRFAIVAVERDGWVLLSLD